MEAHKQEFIEFMVESGVLTFGDFVTKSGRKTPFFINTGNYNSGRQMLRLGRAYAGALHRAFGTDFDCLFGPAYKGIPLATVTAAVLADEYGHDVRFAFNRKEDKDHGEGGSLIGHAPRDGERWVIIEDVTTAGTSVRESIPMLKADAAVEVVGLAVSVDRMERGRGALSALAELRSEFGLTSVPIVTLAEIVDHLTGREVAGKTVIDEDIRKRIDAYRAEYGAAD
jgi:orotate phosphoribosyltransferase